MNDWKIVLRNLKNLNNLLKIKLFSKLENFKKRKKCTLYKTVNVSNLVKIPQKLLVF